MTTTQDRYSLCLLSGGSSTSTYFFPFFFSLLVLEQTFVSYYNILLLLLRYLHAMTMSVSYRSSRVCPAVVVLLSCHCSPPPLLPSILIQFNTIIVAVNHVGPHTQTLVLLSRSRSNSEVHNPTTILFFYSTQLHLASHIHTPVCLSILLLGSSIDLQQLQQQQFVICFAFVFFCGFLFFFLLLLFLQWKWRWCIVRRGRRQ